MADWRSQVSVSNFQKVCYFCLWHLSLPAPHCKDILTRIYTNSILVKRGDLTFLCSMKKKDTGHFRVRFAFVSTALSVAATYQELLVRSQAVCIFFRSWTESQTGCCQVFDESINSKVKVKNLSVKRVTDLKKPWNMLQEELEAFIRGSFKEKFQEDIKPCWHLSPQQNEKKKESLEKSKEKAAPLWSSVLSSERQQNGAVKVSFMSYLCYFSE